MSLEDLPEPSACVLDKNGVERPSYVTIPQPDGSEKHIQTHDVTDATKLLGLQFTTVGDSSVHVDEKFQNGYEWVDNLMLKPMSRRDAWTSMFRQLYPGMKWGMVAVIMPIKELDKKVGNLYYNMLPPLGVNRNIGKG